MQTPYTTYKLDDTCTVIEEGHVRCFLIEGRIPGEDTVVFGNAVKLHCGKAGRFLCDPILRQEV